MPDMYIVSSGLFQQSKDNHDLYKLLRLQALDGKHIFEVPLDEVAEVQGAKEDAIMEFHVDDAALRSREDALTSVTFVLPEGNTDFAGALYTDSHATHVRIA